MSWKRRLAALSFAGGALAASPGCTPFACNANPDPCCSQPGSAACMEWDDCRNDGGTFSSTQMMGADGGTTVVQGCFLPDGGLAGGG